MRAMLWIAASGVLFASGSALADTDRSFDQGFTVRNDYVAKAAPARSGDATILDQGPAGSGQGLSKMQPADVRPHEKAPSFAAVPVTVDPAHPGGDFPFGG